jgi:hypothetical protein
MPRVRRALGSKTHKAAGVEKSLPVIYVVWLQHARVDLGSRAAAGYVRVTTSTHQRVSADCWLRRCERASEATLNSNAKHTAAAPQRLYECRRSPPLGAQPVCFVNSLALFVREHSLTLSLARSGQSLFDKIDQREEKLTCQQLLIGSLRPTQF